MFFRFGFRKFLLFIPLATDYFSMMKMNPTRVLLAAMVLTPSLAMAHTGLGHATSFTDGVGHPLAGLDHLCAMVAVGLWAAQMGGRATWLVPATFVSVMALGGLLGTGIVVPGIETGILVSVLTLGVLIAAAVRLPLFVSAALVGIFALCHGYAHGAEMPGNASGLSYAAGFLLMTTFLHLAGVSVGVGIQKISRPLVVRFAGLAVALCGVYLWLSA